MGVEMTTLPRMNGTVYSKVDFGKVSPLNVPIRC